MGGFDWIKDNVGKTLNGMVSEKPRQAIDSNAEGNVEKTPTALASLSLSTPTKTETASIINTPINSAESMGTTNLH